MRNMVWLVSIAVLLMSSLRCAGGPLDGYVIVIDPGHGVGYPGPRGAAGESGFSHWTAVYLAESLRQRGATVHLTPSSLNVNERAGMANRVGADLLVSIHGDDSNNRFGRGVQTIYELSRPTNDSRSRSAAGIIQGSMVTALGRHGAVDAGFGAAGDGRTRLSSLGLLREAKVPSVLVEVGMAPGSGLRQRLDQEVGQMRTGALSTKAVTLPEGNALHVVSGLTNGIQTYLQHDSSKATQGERPGGVLLDRPADVMFHLSNIRGAVFDRAAGRLVLIGDRETQFPALVPSYIGTAIRCARAREGPGVSIDPGGAAGSMKVRYIGPVEGTALGLVLFEADRLLKCLSLGRDNVTGEALRCPIDGFRTFPELLAGEGGWQLDSSRTLARFWFLPRRVSVVLNHAGDAAAFEEVSLELKAEVLDPRAPPGIRQAADAFASHFTEHYDEFALEYPVLAELKQVAQASALARWFVDERVPIPESVMAAEGERIDTPQQTPAVAVPLEGSQIAGVQVQIAGGVDLSPQGAEIIYSRALRIPSLIAAGVRQRPSDGESAWGFSHDSRRYNAVAFAGRMQDGARQGFTPARFRTLACIAALMGVVLVGWIWSRLGPQQRRKRIRC